MRKLQIAFLEKLKKLLAERDAKRTTFDFVSPSYFYNAARHKRYVTCVVVSVAGTVPFILIFSHAAFILIANMSQRIYFYKYDV